MLTILGAMDRTGMLAAMTVEAATDGEVFLAYLDDALCPKLRSGHVLAMDNLRRRDVWINLLQKLALAMSPPHPVLAWLDRRVSFERELACDDDVLKSTRAPKAYAECLTRLAESRMVQRGFSLVLGALGPLGRQPKLVRRVQRILSAPPVRMGRRRSAGLTASLFVGILTGAALLARSPHRFSFNSKERLRRKRR